MIMLTVNRCDASRVVPMVRTIGSKIWATRDGVHGAKLPLLFSSLVILAWAADSLVRRRRSIVMGGVCQRLGVIIDRLQSIWREQIDPARTHRITFEVVQAHENCLQFYCNLPISTLSSTLRSSGARSAELLVTGSRTVTSLSARANAIPSSQPWNRLRKASASRLRPSTKPSGDPGGTKNRIGRSV